TKPCEYGGTAPRRYLAVLRVDGGPGRDPAQQVEQPYPYLRVRYGEQLDQVRRGGRARRVQVSQLVQRPVQRVEPAGRPLRTARADGAQVYRYVHRHAVRLPQFAPRHVIQTLEHDRTLVQSPARHAARLVALPKGRPDVDNSAPPVRSHAHAGVATASRW